jgi:hypothetical protein
MMLLLTPSAGAQILDPLAKCIKEAINETPPRIKKTASINSNAVNVDIICHQETARALYEVMGKWARSKDGPKKQPNNEVAEYRYFGERSQCRRELEDAYGKPYEWYTCWVTLQLDPSLMAAIGAF